MLRKPGYSACLVRLLAKPRILILLVLQSGFLRLWRCVVELFLCLRWRHCTLLLVVLVICMLTMHALHLTPPQSNNSVLFNVVGSSGEYRVCVWGIIPLPLFILKVHSINMPLQTKPKIDIDGLNCEKANEYAMVSCRPYDFERPSTL